MSHLLRKGTQNAVDGTNNGTSTALWMRDARSVPGMTTRVRALKEVGSDGDGRGLGSPLTNESKALLTLFFLRAGLKG